MAKDPILIVDDDAQHLYMLKTNIKDWGYAAATAGSGAEALSLCGKKKFSLILMDVRMEGMDGLATLSRIKEDEGALLNRDTPVIIMTAYSRVPDAVFAVKTGAFDYLIKPLDMDVLKKTMEKTLERFETAQDKGVGLWSEDGSVFLGESPLFKDVLELVERVAPTDATVLILGESGVGKEVVARLIKEKSERADGPFIAINCGALSETITESELFGHVKGAFTGASADSVGILKAANGGTVFLDEIGEISPATQVKLLRTLQDGEIQPLGSDKTIKVDVRFIAATNKDLAKEAEEKRFREDLFYRLNVVNIYIPPLRQRREDILPLAEFFVGKFITKYKKGQKGFKNFTKSAADAILNHEWHGNIRELQNAMERAVILSRGEEITIRDLPMNVTGKPEKSVKIPLNLEERNKLAVKEAMEETGGNKTQAAKMLGVTRKTLQSMIKKLEADDEEGGGQGGGGEEEKE
jgi:two-component system response regulator HydG